MKKIYDGVVIGSGPAGAAFLYTVSPKYDIACLTKKASRKVCGGLLSPSAVNALGKMGLRVPENVRCSPDIRYIRTVDLNDGFTRYYPRNYVNVDRSRFDEWLMSLSRGKYDEYYGTCTGFVKEDGLYKVKYKDGDVEKFLYCRSIIGADGANSAVRRTFTHEKHRKDLYVAIQQWFNASECGNHRGVRAFSCFFDNEVSDSYAWSFTKGDKIAFGGAYPKKDSRKRFEAEKDKLAHNAVTFGKPLETEACTVVFGQKGQKFLLGMRNEMVYLAGEAAGFISPSSLEGISSALISGSELGRIFTPKVSVLGLYEKKTAKLRLKLRTKLIKSTVLCTPLLRKAVMRSGITAVDLYQG